MAKSRYRQMQETIEKIENDKFSAFELKQMVSAYKNMHSLEELLKSLKENCYQLEYVQSKVHAQELLRDIEKKWDDRKICEIEKMNGLPMEQIRKKLEEKIEIRSIENKYQAEYRNIRKSVLGEIRATGGTCDIFSVLKQLENEAKRLKNEMELEMRNSRESE